MREGGGDVGVDGLLLEAGVLEEFLEGFEGGVEVGDPEQEEFFERDLAVGDSVARALEPLRGGELAAEYVDVGELLGKGEEETFELGWFRLRGEPADGFGEDVGVDLLAIAGDEGVAELVNEAHGEERTGVVCAGWIGVGAAGLVEGLGELAAGGDIGEDYVPAIAEEQVVDLGCFSDGAGDMEFHLRCLRPLQ